MRTWIRRVETIKVIGIFGKLPVDVLAGMSGTAQFTSRQP